jgi:hypothetical protein
MLEEANGGRQEMSARKRRREGSLNDEVFPEGETNQPPPPTDEDNVSLNQTNQTNGEEGDRSFTEVIHRRKTHNRSVKIRANEPDPLIYRYPIILEDEGSGSDRYKNYGFDTNKIWSQNKVGSIKCQRECGKGQHPKWIIECCSAKQQRQIAQTTALKTAKGTIKIKTRVPEEKTEGVVGPIPVEYTAPEVAELIQQNRQNVKISGLHRLTTRDGSKSKAMRVVFLAKRLPKTVQIGTKHFAVEPYRRQVKRCTRCQKLDHDKRECTSKHPPRCPKCLEEAHPAGTRECKLEKSQWKCINCNKRGHSSAFGGVQRS